jgi:hypothetical protein
MGSVNFINTGLSKVQYIKTNITLKKGNENDTKLNVNKLASKTNKMENNIIIFDWDDTLMCTSFLMDNNLFKDNFKIPDIELSKIDNLQRSVFKILKMALEVGNVYIVTNAAHGWVEHSINAFFPLIKPLLKSIRVISARTLYETKFPNDMMQWKTLTYLDLQKHYLADKSTNLVCIGDSPLDMHAAKVLASTFSDCYLKTVKFKDSPKIDELDKQLCLVISKFYDIIKSTRTVSIKVEKKMRN